MLGERMRACIVVVSLHVVCNCIESAIMELDVFVLVITHDAHLLTIQAPILIIPFNSKLPFTIVEIYTPTSDGNVSDNRGLCVVLNHCMLIC